MHLTDTGFVKTSSITFNHGSFWSKGDYRQSGDTLILHHKPWPEEKSVLEIKKQSTYKNTWDTANRFTLIELRIMDTDSIPIQNCFVSLKDVKEVVLATILSDEKGQLSYYTNNSQIQTLQCRMLGYRAIDIDIDDFRGFNTELNIYLKVDDYNSFNQREFEERFILNKKRTSMISFPSDSSSFVWKLKKN
ncbi:hypothetical protein [Roseivirga seohaensis]|uniref:hypothetical protein n=1 Tax=Roseivirga seohaensis TaxID=1914963 RepID=UPI003BA9C477